MGRITIFSADGCPHSRRVKGVLNNHNIPFTEISITSYPQKRADMVALSNRLSTPQIFFNTRHIGGADDAIRVLQEWDAAPSQLHGSAYERYVAEIASFPDPWNPRFDIPNESPVRPETIRPRHTTKDLIALPNDSQTTVLDLTETLKSILPIQSRRFHLTVHANCFLGSQAVDALVEHYQIARDEAVALGQRFQQSGLLHHVTGEHAFQDSSLLYRLQCHHTPSILNSYRLWTTQSANDPMQLAEYLKDLMSQIECAVTDNNGQLDYLNATKCPLFPVLEEALCELQTVDVSAMNDDKKTAFGINIYNLMITYASIKLGVPETNMTRHAFFTNVTFNIGGKIYSFQDWEHGILRGNRKAPHGLSSPFSRSDSRRVLAVNDPDYRVHFGLNCGAKSCPPVNQYTDDNLDEELRIVAESFCEDDDNVTFDADKGEVQLSKIFQWYRSDFADNNAELLRVVKKHLRGTKRQTLDKMIDKKGAIKVTYKPYDWTSSASRHRPFDPLILKPDRRSVARLPTRS